jgi:hypothetical protein
MVSILSLDLLIHHIIADVSPLVGFLSLGGIDLRAQWIIR